MRQYKGRKRIGKTQDTRRTTQGRRQKSERLKRVKRLKRRVGEREKGRKGEKRHKTQDARRREEVVFIRIPSLEGLGVGKKDAGRTCPPKLQRRWRTHDTGRAVSIPSVSVMQEWFYSRLRICLCLWR